MSNGTDRETRREKNKAPRWKCIGSDPVLSQCRASRLPLAARGAVLLRSCITGCHASCRRSTVLHWCMRRVHSDSARSDQTERRVTGRRAVVLSLPLMALTMHNSLSDVIFRVVSLQSRSRKARNDVLPLVPIYFCRYIFKNDNKRASEVLMNSS